MLRTALNVRVIGLDGTSSLLVLLRIHVMDMHVYGIPGTAIVTVITVQVKIGSFHVFLVK